MTQGIMELIFDVAYLTTAMVIGLLLLIKGKTRFFILFGSMAVLLSGGDAFHLVPRVIALLGDGLDDHAFSLGLGKLITSITMTGFYILLYFILEIVYRPSKSEKIYFRSTLFVLSAARIILCCFPQNDWFSSKGDLLWGIWRNIPFALIGVMIIALSFATYRRTKDKYYFWMAVLVLLSFGFYLPVVLWADEIRFFGTFMIPKTLAYVVILLIGLFKFLESKRLNTSK